MRVALTGVLAPVVSTFDPRSGDISSAPFRANLGAHLDAGLAGVLVAGSSGEASLLDEQERGRLLEWAREAIPQDRLLLAGCGAESTRHTVRRCREAAKRGADAALLLPPHYYLAAMTPEALRAHFQRVADASPIPILLYNNPRFAHTTLDPSLVHELAQHGNVPGMKDSSGDLSLLARYLDAQSDRFTVLTGHGGTLHQALNAGARGGILAVALFAGQLAVELFGCVQRGERERAESLQDALRPLAAEIVARLGVAGMKEAMDRAGLAGGPVRPPLLPLRAADRELVASLLRSAELARAA